MIAAVFKPSFRDKVLFVLAVAIGGGGFFSTLIICAYFLPTPFDWCMAITFALAVLAALSVFFTVD